MAISFFFSDTIQIAEVIIRFLSSLLSFLIISVMIERTDDGTKSFSPGCIILNPIILKEALTMKKIVALVLVSLLLMALSLSALADYTPGVTTVADPDSPTGFTTTIVFEAPGAESVTLSGSFAFHKYGRPLGAEHPDYYTPEQWEDGMFAHGQESHKMPMDKVEGTDYFVKVLQLPSGHYQYAFYVDNAETRVDDPTNPGQYALVENGGKYTRSVFDVPYNAEKQPKSQDYIYAA